MPPLAGAAIGAGIAGATGGALATGATLGGLAGSAAAALPSIFGGGGGGSSQPAAQPVQTNQGLFQSYTPQDQQGQDYTFQGLQNYLDQQAYTGLGALPSGTSPYAALYGQYGGIGSGLMAQADAGPIQGGYGSYGTTALGGALGVLDQYNNILGGQNNLVNYGQATGQAGLQALPQTQQAAFSPQIGQAAQNIIANPYNQQQLLGALSGANIGQWASGQAPGAVDQLSALGQRFPGLGQQAATTTQSQVPFLQNLAGDQATTATGLTSAAEQLPGQLAQLYGQTVPGLLQAGGQYAAAAGATNPQLQQMAQSGIDLTGQAQPWAQRAQATTPQLQGIGASGANLAGAAPGLAGAALGTNAGLANAQQRILQTGQDPQGALFNQLTQQTRDQANAMNAMSGLAGTPYAAGVANDAMRNFDINWQNQQLQRQATADQAAAGLASQQLAGVQGAGGLLQNLATAGGQLGLNAAQQQLANTQAGANILGGLTQQGQNINLGALQQQLANTTAGGQLYGSLVGAAGQLGGNLNTGQLSALTQAGNIYNQGAQGAGSLAQTAGGLTNQALAQEINAANAAQNLFQGGLNLGQTGSQLATAAAAAPAAAYNAQQRAALDALAQQSNIYGGGVGQLANLTNQMGAAGQQPITGLQALNDFAARPAALAQQQQQNAMTALTNQANFGNQVYSQPQQVINNALAYLGRGQAAASIAGQLQNQGFAQTQQQVGGLGALGLGGLNALTGGGGGSNLLFGNQGLGGALGINPQTGLLGGLFGGGGTAGLGSGGLSGPWMTLGGDYAALLGALGG